MLDALIADLEMITLVATAGLWLGALWIVFNSPKFRWRWLWALLSFLALKMAMLLDGQLVRLWLPVGPALVLLYGLIAPKPKTAKTAPAGS